jgi:hypothetical protein
MKAWKTMVKRIKKVPPHLAKEIRWGGKYMVGLSNQGSFVNVKHRKRAWQTEELGPLPLSLTRG